MKRIVIAPYAAEWPRAFKKLRAVLSEDLEGLYVSIEHVGSTAVPGLAAKPILDIDVVIEPFALTAITARLRELGYEPVGDRGIPGRYAFERPNARVPYHKDAYWMNHHLYVCIAGSAALGNHIAFRDYLREHQWAVKQYAKLKRLLAKTGPHNISRYVTFKSGFIASALLRQGMNEDDVASIRAQNAMFNSRRNHFSS